jgi:hypothetical protein
MQAVDLDRPRHPRFREVWNNIYRSNGIRGYYKGLNSCLLRAAPSNAAGFYGFEKSMHFFKGKQH